jgi:hypothetical protein
MASTWREKSVSSRGHWFSPVVTKTVYQQVIPATSALLVEINDRSLTPGEGARIAATRFATVNTSAQNRKNQHIELDL